MASIAPSLVRDFLMHVIGNKERYSYNVRHRNHVVVHYRQFYAYLFTRGIDASLIEISSLFRIYVLGYLEELKEKGLVKEYWTEKSSRKVPMKVHIILADGAGGSQ